MGMGGRSGSDLDIMALAARMGLNSINVTQQMKVPEPEPQVEQNAKPFDAKQLSLMLLPQSDKMVRCVLDFTQGA